MHFKSFLMSAAAALAMTSTASAQSASPAPANDPHDHLETETFELDEISVRALPLGRAGSDVGSHVALLSGDTFIQRRQPTLGETLTSIPGVNADTFGGGASRPVVRGQTSPRVKVLSEGAGLIDAAEVSPDHAISGEPMLMEGVEILRGPSALLYGGGAIGGAVNLLDKKVPTAIPANGGEGVVEYRHSTVNNEDVGVAGVTVGAGNFALRLEAVGRSSDDYRIADSDEKRLDGTFNNSFTGTLGASWIGDKGYLGAAYTRQKSTYGLAGHSHEFASCHPHGIQLHCGGHDDHGHDDHDDDHDDHDHDHGHDHPAPVVRLVSDRFDLRGDWVSPMAGVERIRLRAGHTDYRHDELEEGEILTTFTNKGYDARLEVQHTDWNGLRGVIGTQISRSDFAAEGVESYLQPTQTKSVGVFLMEEYEIGNWHLEGAIRQDWQELTTLNKPTLKHEPLSVSASAVWHFAPQWTTALSIARSQRAPTAQEAFARGVHLATNTYEMGTATLDVETSNSLELTLRKTSGTLTGSVSAYRYAYDDYIYANTLDQHEDFRLIRYEQADATFTGVEGELRQQITPWLGATVFGDYVRAELKGDGGNLPRIPAARIGLRADVLHNNWSGDVEYVRTFKQDDIAAFERETPGYDMVNATVAYDFDLADLRTQVFLRGTNLLDERALNHASYLAHVAPLKGRGLSVGIRARF